METGALMPLAIVCCIWKNLWGEDKYDSVLIYYQNPRLPLGKIVDQLVLA